VLREVHGPEGAGGLLAPSHGSAPRGTEAVLACLLAEVLHVEQVPGDANFFDDLGADSMVMAQFCARVRKRTDLPSVSIKDIYQHPTITGLATALAPPSSNPVEQAFTQLLAEVLHVEQVPGDANFFDDLGADSMVMAQFCARVRKRTDLPTISIKDVYTHPTIRSLVTAVTGVALISAESAPPSTEVHRASTREYVVSGILQLAIFLGYAYLMALVLEAGFQYIWAGGDLLNDYVRSIVVGGLTFLGMSVLPILAKWVLIGRWRPQEIPIWSLAYVRFWLVKQLVRANPMVLFVGSPLYVLYLRALGAKIGRGVVILTRFVPVCTDLLTIGDGTVVRNFTYFTCYRAHHGVIQTGRVTVGKDVFVGENVVLDIDTSIGDGAQLGQTSSLHARQAVPAGEHWHGSPGRRTEIDYRVAPPVNCGTRRRVVYSVMQLLTLTFVYLPLAFGGIALLLVEFPPLAVLLEGGAGAFATGSFWIFALETSLVLYFGSLILRLLFVISVPRLLALPIKPDRVYPLYGIHYALHRTVTKLTNVPFFKQLFGDTSFIVPYLLGLGYELKPVVQTGSNFGMALKQETPYLSHVSTGTVVASGLHIMNADFSSSSFMVSRTSIGANNFLGNWIWYPTQGRTGDNCLLGTKVLVPVDGEVRESVGLLGSPSFEIPRTVERDNKFIEMAHDEEFPRRLAAKNRHNLATIGIQLLARWVSAFVLTVLAFFTVDLFHSFGAATIAMSGFLVVCWTILYFAFVERASTGFKGVRPRYCSIYDIEFWRVERFFKLSASLPYKMVDGTPYKSMVLKLLGVRVGKRLFDNGAVLDEKNIVTFGDDVTLNEGTHIQCHSQEDYAFKCDGITIDSGATVGVGAWVHYGTSMGEGSVLAPDAFLMKGGEMPAFTHWGGNPAEEMRDDLPALPAPPAMDEPPALPAPAAVPPPPRSGGRHRAGQRAQVPTAAAGVTVRGAHAR
jgi:non-ribosomal peptide synthetase-like protein